MRQWDKRTTFALATSPAPSSHSLEPRHLGGIPGGGDRRSSNDLSWSGEEYICSPRRLYSDPEREWELKGRPWSSVINSSIEPKFNLIWGGAVFLWGGAVFLAGCWSLIRSRSTRVVDRRVVTVVRLWGDWLSKFRVPWLEVICESLVRECPLIIIVDSTADQWVVNRVCKGIEGIGDVPPEIQGT